MQLPGSLSGVARRVRSDPRSGPVRTVVSLTFDDGWASQYDAARPILGAHGMTATFFVNSNLVGAEGRVTWPQLEALAADGHEIGGHSLDHLDLAALGRDEALRQVAGDRANLLARGFDVRSFAYPGGAYDSTTEGVVRECGYASGRGAYGLRNLEQPPGDRRPLAERIPPNDLYGILAPCCLWSTTSLEKLIAYVETAERKGGGWVPLVLHRVCDDCGGEEPAPSISPATLAAFLDWLEPRAAAGTIVRTVAEVIVTELSVDGSTADGSGRRREATPSARPKTTDLTRSSCPASDR